jgi:hypothetical protein
VTHDVCHILYIHFDEVLIALDKRGWSIIVVVAILQRVLGP